MHVLQTRSKPLEKPRNSCQVEWYVSEKCCGFLDVELQFEHTRLELPVLCELLAIQHLLFDLNIFAMPMTMLPSNVILRVSSIEILEALHDSEHLCSNIYKASAFFRNRFRGVNVELFKDESLFDVIPSSAHSTYTAESPSEIRFTHLIVDTPSMGELLVNTHAIDQFIAYLDCQPLRNPLKSLVTRMNNPELIRMSIPKNVLRHKLFKYKNNENIEVWGHQTAMLRFLIINEQGVRTLRTVFKKT